MPPTRIVAAVGAMLTDNRVVSLTVSVVEPDTIELFTVKLPVMVVVPAATPVATDLFMLATPGLDELHVT